MKNRISTLNLWVNFSLCFLMILLLVSDGQGAGKNIALHRSVTFSPKPGYSQTTDKDDARQLTDGKYAPQTEGSSMWFFKETVG